MKNIRAFVASVTLAAAVAALPMSTSFAQTQNKGADAHAGHNMSEMSDASSAYMKAMDKMNEDMKTMKMSGKAGIDFAEMMIPHHQSAIDMAKAYLASDEKDPDLSKLSEEIVKAQESEIKFLKDWLAKNKK